MGLLLYILSVILVYLLNVPIIIYSLFRVGSWKKGSEYFRSLAHAIDQYGNPFGKYAFSDFFVKEGGYEFGNPDETLSSVFGVNQYRGTLKYFGRVMRKIIDKMFGKNHCRISIDAKLHPDIPPFEERKRETAL